MQYLSKAYSYYSGINPATLSGAIDVIVVRHVDDKGEATLSSSPFHVRFGKLQVLRAGEKRVTIRLPNNLPPPHIVPFSMKVGEAGEAFFVLETAEDVPVELLTSPVIMPSDDTSLPPAPPPSDEDLSKQGSDVPAASGHQAPTFTHQPFGETEEMVRHKEPGNEDNDAPRPLRDVDFLDLNASTTFRDLQQEEEPVHPTDSSKGKVSSELPSQPSIDPKDPASTTSPSSILNTATALLPSIPSIPFLSSRTSSNPGSPAKERASVPSSPPITPGDPSRHDPEDRSEEKPKSSRASPPPNPMVAQPGESTDLPQRNVTLSDYSKKLHSKGSSGQEADECLKELPKVIKGEGEGPQVFYGKDVVLDMAGYYTSGTPVDKEADGEERGFSRPGSEAEPKEEADFDVDINHLVIKDVLVHTFAQDLLISVESPPDRYDGPVLRPKLASRATDSALIDGLSPSSFSSSTDEVAPVPPAVDPLSLDTDLPIGKKSLSLSRERHNREPSEPPHVSEQAAGSKVTAPLSRSHSIHPGETGGATSSSEGSITPATRLPTTTNPNAAMDYAWDWRRLPDHSIEDDDGKQSKHNMERSLSGPPVRSTRTAKDSIRNDHMPAAELDAAIHSNLDARAKAPLAVPGKLKNIEESPYMFVLEMGDGRSHTFELALCGTDEYAQTGEASDEEENAFLKSRVSFQRFIEDPHIVDDPHLVIRYSILFLSWKTGYHLLYALTMYRRSLSPPGLGAPGVLLPSLNDIGVLSTVPPRPSTGYGWSKWWRRGPPNGVDTGKGPPSERRQSTPLVTKESPDPSPPPPSASPPAVEVKPDRPETHYAKTLRLTSEQLKQLNLKSGPNTVQFSVTSSYSGVATCTARIFLWDADDQVVISDIDGTITKSDALGHVFAAIGRDWTHPGIARLYTDICNNGYKILYLTSRAIGQADSTREYLKSIVQGDYRLPEGPVIMSPDRLMASLHREVIMRKPELFKMACLRDIQRLFDTQAKEAFFAGFGNRITDAMSYRSVGIGTSKIFTIDSTGVVKIELLQGAGHRGSYVGINTVVNEVFPPVNTKFKPEFTDFNYWRASIVDIPLPDLRLPPSPALSARSDTSSRLNVGMLGKIASLGLRSSRQPLLPTAAEPSSRPSSPLIGPALTADDLSEDDDDSNGRRSRESSMPGSFEEHHNHFGAALSDRSRQDEERDLEEGRRKETPSENEDEGNDDRDSFDDGAIFDDDILAAGEMKHVPF